MTVVYPDKEGVHSLASLIVRDLAPEVLALLHKEAEERHTSVDAVVRDALALHVSRRRRRAVLQEMLLQSGAIRDAILTSREGAVTTDSTLLIREDRMR